MTTEEGYRHALVRARAVSHPSSPPPTPDRQLILYLLTKARRYLQTGYEEFICDALERAAGTSEGMRMKAYPACRWCRKHIIDAGIDANIVNAQSLPNWLRQQMRDNPLNVSSPVAYGQMMQMARIAWLDKLIEDYSDADK